MKEIIALSTGMLIACTAAMAQTASQQSTTTTVEQSQQAQPTKTHKFFGHRFNPGVTAENQSNTKSDTDVTIALRKSIMAEKGLSTDAQNIKIITRGKVVLLRGTVDSEDEKALISTLAEQTCGAKKFNNQLEVKSHISQK